MTASPFPGITDDLTGLCNQAYFHRFLYMEIKRTHYRHYHIGLVLIVFDDFTAVQAAAGRPAADRLLHETGRIITNSIREVDRVTRYKHQYFAGMLPMQTDKVSPLLSKGSVGHSAGSHFQDSHSAPAGSR